ncbi:MAG: phosphate acyltransferase [Bacteroidota bacterium]
MHCAETIRGRRLAIVFPEGDDDRVIAAARMLRDDDLARPVLIGHPDAIGRAAERAAVSVAGLTTVDPRSDERLESYVDRYASARSIERNVAMRLVRRPLFFAGMMVAGGDADAAIAGAVTPTATVIQGFSLTVGPAPGLETPSSFFLMVLPARDNRTERILVFADCAVNVAPSPRELADIAVATAASATRYLPEPPRVALLSFSTHGSASHERVDHVRQALERTRELEPSLVIDGELQADAALVPEVALKKTSGSDVAGRANVLVFPDLNSGNIAYKLTQYLAEARALGPFLQGFARPVSDLSRGASIDDIVTTAIVTLARSPQSAHETRRKHESAHL